MRPFSSPEKWHPVIERVVRQRMGEHADLAAVADAIEQRPALPPLRGLARPRSADHAGHRRRLPRRGRPRAPLAVGERYADAIPGAVVRTEDAGQSPLAWQGGQLSRIIAETAARDLKRSTLNARITSEHASEKM